jgi:hypothetical protein
VALLKQRFFCEGGASIQNIGTSSSIATSPESNLVRHPMSMRMVNLPRPLAQIVNDKRSVSLCLTQTTSSCPHRRIISGASMGTFSREERKCAESGLMSSLCRYILFHPLTCNA